MLNLHRRSCLIDCPETSRTLFSFQGSSAGWVDTFGGLYQVSDPTKLLVHPVDVLLEAFEVRAEVIEALLLEKGPLGEALLL